MKKGANSERRLLIKLKFARSKEIHLFLVRHRPEGLELAASDMQFSLPSAGIYSLHFSWRTSYENGSSLPLLYFFHHYPCFSDFA